MELIAVSDFIMPDEIDDIFEIGHFNDSERLQIILRDANGEIVIYNLPEEWQAPYLGIKPIVSQVPLMFALFQPYPNPFNSTTSISYTLPKSSEVRLSIHDIHGREITVIQDGVKKEGYHTTVWNASEIPTGMYFIQLEAGGLTKTRKVMLLR